MKSHLLLPALLLATSVSVGFAKNTVPTQKPASNTHSTTSSTHTTTAAKTSQTAAATPASSAEIPLPVDPFTKIDSVLTGADADTLKAAVTEAGKDDGVIKATKVSADCLTKYQSATPGTKSSALDSLKGSIKALFAAEKSVILRGNAKLSASIDKVEKAK